jgi:predicted Fe-Mo cluster-binding NifX family protein
VKLAVTSSGNDLSAPVDSRFGRAAKFIVYDLEAGTFTVLDNEQNFNAPQGAGIQAAQNVVRSGAGALVTGHCGPKAFRVLAAAGVKVYTLESASVADAVERFRKGSLTEAVNSDVEGHW